MSISHRMDSVIYLYNRIRYSDKKFLKITTVHKNMDKPYKHNVKKMKSD